MTKTEIQIQTEDQELASVENWLDNLDPATATPRDARHLRRIAALREDISAAQGALREAVRAARADGDSWSAVGIALGTTRQAAFQRFADVDKEPAPAPEPVQKRELFSFGSRSGYIPSELADQLRSATAQMSDVERDEWLRNLITRVLAPR